VAGATVAGATVAGATVAGATVAGATVAGATVAGATVAGATDEAGGTVVAGTVVAGTVVAGLVQSPVPVAVFLTPVLGQYPSTVSEVPEKLTVVEPPAGIFPEWPSFVVNDSALSASELTISQTPGD